MPKRFLRVLFGAALMSSFSCYYAQAGGFNSIGSDTTASSSLFSESLSYQGLSEQEEISQWKWNAGYTFLQTTSGTAPTAIVDKTSEITAGFGWEGWKAFETGLSLTYSKTPDESLSTLGGTLTVGYTYRFESELYRPSIGARLTVGKTTYDQSVQGLTAKPGRKNPPARQILIPQRSTALELNTGPVEWLFLRFLFTHYHYDENVNTLLTQLDSAQGIISSGLGSTVGGFASRSSEFAITLYPLDDWTIDLSVLSSTNASDSSKSTESKLLVEWEFIKSWHAALGLQKSVAVTINENALLVNLSYDF